MIISVSRLLLRERKCYKNQRAVYIKVGQDHATGLVVGNILSFMFSGSCTPPRSLTRALGRCRGVKTRLASCGRFRLPVPCARASAALTLGASLLRPTGDFMLMVTVHLASVCDCWVPRLRPGACAREGTSCWKPRGQQPLARRGRTPTRCPLCFLVMRVKQAPVKTLPAHPSVAIPVGCLPFRAPTPAGLHSHSPQPASQGPSAQLRGLAPP